MPQYLYRIQPKRLDVMTGPTPEEMEIVGRHFAYLQQLQADGILFLAGRTTIPDGNAFGLTLFVAADDAAAEAIMLADPGVAEGLMSATLFPFQTLLVGELPSGEG